MQTVASSRIIDEEPDAIVQIPLFPDYIVVATYTLVKGDESGVPDSRRGSLRIIPFLSSSTQVPSLQLDRKDFEFGIYDIQFHPRYHNVLGAATSDAEILFFDVFAIYDDAGDLQRLQLLERGSLIVEQPHIDDGRLAIVTQLQFLDLNADAEELQLPNSSHNPELLFAATTQFGATKLISTILPLTGAHAASGQLSMTQSRNIHMQSFDLEAWVVLAIVRHGSEHPPHSVNRSKIVIISGGDDSQLLVSLLESNPDADTDGSNQKHMTDRYVQRKLFADARTHDAGIVALCPLDTITLPNSVLVLSGSYDEKIRLLSLSLPSASNTRCSSTTLGEFKLPGGVWRIVKLDSYRSVKTDEFHFILLIAGHTAGAMILRLRCVIPEHSVAHLPEYWKCEWKLEKQFIQHESLVYTVTARMKQEKRGQWEVVSASFYDKLICNWEWEDEVWKCP